MSGYLDNYGVTDARRESKIKRIVIASVVALLLLSVGYYYFHDFTERRQVSSFFDLLRQNKIEDAYRIWGCDPAQPCRDYNLDKFREDWGPNGLYASLKDISPRRTRSCQSGVLFIYQTPKAGVVTLTYGGTPPALSFGPINFQGEPLQHCADSLGRYENFGDKFFHVWDRIFR